MPSDTPAGCPTQVQKENYRQEKKRATKQLLSALTDPRVVIMADSLKVGVTGMRVHAAHSGGPRRGLAVASHSADRSENLLRQIRAPALGLP